MRGTALFSLLHLAASGAAQLIGRVGPTTALGDKSRECNVLHYGAVNNNSTDIADALETAFRDCVLHHPKSRLVVPEGEYLLNRSVVLSNGTNWAFQLEGLITLAYGGNYSVDRELVLQGYAGVQPLNDTVNGEGDHLFLENGLVIINGTRRSSPLESSVFLTHLFAQRLISSSSPRPARAHFRGKAIYGETQTSKTIAVIYDTGNARPLKK